MGSSLRNGAIELLPEALHWFASGVRKSNRISKVDAPESGNFSILLRYGGQHGHLIALENKQGSVG